MRLSTLAAVALVLLGLWFQFAAPSPGPEPGPDPVPPPPPPPVVTKLWVLFVYESDDIDDQYPWMANIVNTQKIRRLASDTLVLKYADDDEKDEKGDTPPSTKPWIEEAKRKKWEYPHIIMADQDGNLVHHGVVPRTVDETAALIKELAP